MCFLLRAMLKNVAERWRVVLFTLRSLTFNSATSRVVVLDTIFQPVFWVVDNFVGVLGPAFVLLVIGLTTSVVVIYYTVLLPVIMEYSVTWIAFHLVTSHWLLLNIAFHYFKAVFTSPGSTPQQTGLDDFGSGKYSICKKCIQPKFPRTHHCSICKRCILKMDHHCPWINNCVGHFNHRYFISFCIFMCIGTFYVAVSSKDLFTKHFYHNNWISTESSPPLLTDGRNSTSVHLRNETQFNHQSKEDSAMDYEHKCVIYLFMLCSAVTVALGVLTGWHCRLIGRGETSIEVHINSEDRKRLRKQGLVFRNPYNFGVWNNWRILLGLVNGRSWLDILLPSSHLPFGDGLSWPPPPPDVKKDGKIHVV